MALPSNIIAYINQAARAYGADPGLLQRMTMLESGGRDVVNDWDSNAKAGTPSAGILQFIKPTFDAYARQARAANPGAWKGVAVQWRNPKAQALAAAWAIQNGKGSAWTTYDRARGGEGASKGAAAPTPEAAPVEAAPTGLPSFDFGSVTDDPIAAGILQSWNNSQESDSPSPIIDRGGTVVPSTVKAGSLGNFKDLISLGKKFGLAIQGDFQTTGGKHSSTSNHYKSRAVDFGDANNSQEALRALAAYARANPGQFSEVYFNPLGWGIKNGKVIKGLTQPGHDDHLHIAV